MQFLRPVVLIFMWVVLGNPLKAQNYISYQHTINRVDEDIVAGNLSSAALRLDTIYQNYSFIYAKHCIKALQVSCSLQDEARAARWLEKCYLQGVPEWIIASNEITQKSLHYNASREVINNHDSLHGVYLSSIDTSLAKTIDSLLVIDQKWTNRVNDGFVLLRYTWYYYRWRRNNNKEFKILSDIINAYGFPGEKVIGLPSYYSDTALMAKAISYYGPSPMDGRAYIMLLHCYTNPRRDINGMLYKAVVNGEMPARDYGAINDFMARFGKNRYGKYSYYNVHHHDPGATPIADINLWRGMIGLPTFETQQKYSMIWRERRKEGTANKEIILDW